ncbi:MAG: phosphonate ABC transporter, permease protein PhnE [Candidatus Binatia bacterium]|nr:phosphonate ABC transporter, permease protein PhnE [Candidatus Binatia bacterium]
MTGRKTHWRQGIVAGLFVSVTAAMFVGIGLLDPGRLARGAVNAATFVRTLFPPDLRTLPVLLRAMWETLQIAYVGTLLGCCFALPAALLATHSLFGPAVTVPTRMLLVVIRTIPALLWALVFVVVFGLGPLAGTCATACYTLGHLGKVFYEIFDGVDPEVLEAVSSVGCSRLQLVRFALAPEAANHMLSQLLFVFEYNVRASTIMGFVGAGGIGFYMLGYVQLLQYQQLTTSLLVTLSVVIIIDQLSAAVRRLVLPPSLST